MTDLATVAANLRAIEDMALRLEARAQDQGRRVSSDGDRGIPGGEAMVNLASVGSFVTWNRRVDLREQAGEYTAGEYEDPDDMWPAVQVLWFWSEDYRAQLGHDHDDPRWRPSLLTEAKFLRNHDVAEWIWNNEVHWDDYAADVARAKGKLETVLVEGERAERIAVVCDQCDAGRRLIRVWGDEPAQDRWKCPGCKHLFTDGEIDDVRATQMRRGEPRQWIQRTYAIDLLRSLGHQERVATRLVDDPVAQGWRDEITRVRMVAWPEVWRTHLLEMQRRKLKHARRTA